MRFVFVSLKGPVLTAVYSKEGDYWASGGNDEQVMIWKTNMDSTKQPVSVTPSSSHQQQQQHQSNSAEAMRYSKRASAVEMGAPVAAPGTARSSSSTRHSIGAGITSMHQQQHQHQSVANYRSTSSLGSASSTSSSSSSSSSSHRDQSPLTIPLNESSIKIDHHHQQQQHPDDDEQNDDDHHHQQQHYYQRQDATTAAILAATSARSSSSSSNGRTGAGIYSKMKESSLGSAEFKPSPPPTNGAGTGSILKKLTAASVSTSSSSSSSSNSSATSNDTPLAASAAAVASSSMSPSLASTLEHIVHQLDTLTKTMGVIEHRLTYTEDKLKELVDATQSSSSSSSSPAVAASQMSQKQLNRLSLK